MARITALGSRSALCRAMIAALLVACLVRAAGSEVVEVRTQAITLDPDNPGRVSFGALTLLRGFVLKSDDKRFGGLSGLDLDASGRTLYLISDRGYGLSARLIHDKTGHLTGFDQWVLTPLKTPGGSQVTRRMIDAETVVREPDGAWLVAFEHRHRIWRYPSSPEPFVARPEPVEVPDDLSRAPRNGGIEAMTRLPDGRLLVLTEAFRNADGSLKGWLLSDRRAVGVSYITSDGFVPTGLAALSQGDVLVLERRFRPPASVSMRLRYIPSGQLLSGARLRGRELVSLGPPLTLDNFEGLAAWETPQGDIVLYLISDDNFNFFQQTLFLQFRLHLPDRG